MPPERTHRHGNRQIGLSCSGRTQPEHDGVFGNGTDIAALSHSTGMHRLSGGGETDGVVICQLRQLSACALVHHIRNVVDGLRRHSLSGGNHFQQCSDRSGSQLYRCAVALDAQLVPTADHLHMIPLFQQLEVFVKTAA